MCPCALVRCVLCTCVCSLGLGAAYVPHHKAVGFAAAIDERLKKRLESGAKRKAALSVDEEGVKQVRQPCVLSCLLTGARARVC